ncbi:hypothetical protein HYALB_00009074 [Hymenoscyphus albidus]|uniref:SMP-30/Gluconolactonase/LRE-like region domain-containing protein n=1 Tax=Hymenoscyphus albidus TaxID=595503 RepID=A0A9N9LPG9_9HELO|nr:hypothetical protein HYALB_00009074 [Hymenoscyphus albidus]
MSRNNNFNTTFRSKTDHISILNIDTPGADGLYNIRPLPIPTTYQSASHNQEIDVHAISLYALPAKGNEPAKLRLMINNHRPPVYVDGGGDVAKYGANSTIEVFELRRGSEVLEFVRTIWSPEVLVTPNNLVDLGDGEGGGVLVTNDHSRKVGKMRALEMFWGGGSIAYCPNHQTPCHIATPSTTFNFPNGITQDPEGLIYVANSGTGTITVLSLNTTTQMLDQIHEIDIKMPIDNLRVDSRWDVYVAGSPDVVGLVRSSSKMEGRDVGSSVFRVRMVGEEGVRRWEVVKVLEDVEGKILPASTVVAHDAKTGNLWLGSVASSFITVCEKI